MCGAPSPRWWIYSALDRCGQISALTSGVGVQNSQSPSPCYSLLISLKGRGNEKCTVCRILICSERARLSWAPPCQQDSLKHPLVTPGQMTAGFSLSSGHGRAQSAALPFCPAALLIKSSEYAVNTAKPSQIRCENVFEAQALLFFWECFSLTLVITDQCLKYFKNECHRRNGVWKTASDSDLSAQTVRKCMCELCPHTRKMATF